jgi:hypothetical protein
MPTRIASTFTAELRRHANDDGVRIDFNGMHPISVVAHAAKHALREEEGFHHVHISPADYVVVDRVRVLQALRDVVKNKAFADASRLFADAAAVPPASAPTTRASTKPKRGIRAILTRDPDTLWDELQQFLYDKEQTSFYRMSSELLARIAASSGFEAVEDEVQEDFLKLTGISAVVDLYEKIAEDTVRNAGLTPMHVHYRDKKTKRLSRSGENHTKRLFLTEDATVVIAISARTSTILTCYRNTSGETWQERFEHERDQTVHWMGKTRYTLADAGYCEWSAWVHS